MLLGNLHLYDPSVRVFGSPSRYVQGPRAIDRLGAIAATLGTELIILSDNAVFQIVGQQIAHSCASVGLPFRHVPYDGDLNPETGSNLLQVVKPSAGTVIAAAGGGRTIDAGKAMVELCRLPLVTVPTVASNDAPTSKNFVLYDADHRLLEVRHLPVNPAFVLVDTEVLAAAPRRFFVAGLGDAIAKKFEAENCFSSSGLNMFGASPSRAALAVARHCYDQLLAYGSEACRLAGTGQITVAFEETVEAMLLMAGLGFESGGLSVAHALTRGLSITRGARTAPHGLQVAYALLVQFELEGRPPPHELLEFYRDVGLPKSLVELGVASPDTSDFNKIATATVGVRHMSNFSRKISERELMDAIMEVERRHATASEIFQPTS
jgi:glycerol dehydrogenase